MTQQELTLLDEVRKMPYEWINEPRIEAQLSSEDARQEFDRIVSYKYHQAERRAGIE